MVAYEYEGKYAFRIAVGIIEPEADPPRAVLGFERNEDPAGKRSQAASLLYGRALVYLFSVYVDRDEAVSPEEGKIGAARDRCRKSIADDRTFAASCIGKAGKARNKS